MKRLAILLLLLLTIQSCSILNKPRPCNFKITVDHIEIIYLDTNETVVIPVEEGESYSDAYHRYQKKIKNDG